MKKVKSRVYTWMRMECEHSMQKRSHRSNHSMPTEARQIAFGCSTASANDEQCTNVPYNQPRLSSHTLFAFAFRCKPGLSLFVKAIVRKLLGVTIFQELWFLHIWPPPPPQRFSFAFLNKTLWLHTSSNSNSNEVDDKIQPFFQGRKKLRNIKRLFWWSFICRYISIRILVWMLHAVQNVLYYSPDLT